MRDKRSRLYNDPFYKKDRNVKNQNKVIAAKNRKRDDTGKFNFENQSKQVDFRVSVPQLPIVEQHHTDSVAVNEPSLLPINNNMCQSLPCPPGDESHVHVLTPLAHPASKTVFSWNELLR